MKRKTKLLFRDAFFSTILTGFIVSLLYLAIFNFKFFNPLHQVFEEFSFLDVYYAQRFEENAKINDDIVLVNIEDLDREGIALLLDAVLNADPKVVGFDIILESHERHFTEDSLLNTLLQNDKVVTSFEVDLKGKITQNEPYFVGAKEPSFTNFNFDSISGVIREFTGYQLIESKMRTSFATEIAKNYLSKKKWKKYGYDKKLTEPQIINYSGNLEKFPVLSLEDFMLDDHRSFLKDRVVILGYLGRECIEEENDITDKHWTPLNDRLVGKSNRDMFGPVVHANIANMLIKNDLIYKVSDFWIILFTIICIYFCTMYYMKLNKYYKISYRTRKQTFQFIVCVILLIISFILLTKDIVLNPVLIIIGVLLAGSYFKYYKHLSRYINTKRKWKTYLK